MMVTAETADEFFCRGVAKYGYRKGRIICFHEEGRGLATPSALRTTAIFEAQGTDDKRLKRWEDTIGNG